MATKKVLRRDRLKKGIRKKITGTPDRPRLSVYRSNKDIYAQLIDDRDAKTLVSFSSKQLKSTKGTKVEVSKEVGKKLAELATGNGVKEVVFDRGGYLYHGRVKALAEGAREAGLKF